MVWMKTLTELFDIIEDPYRLFAQMEFTALWFGQRADHENDSGRWTNSNIKHDQMIFPQGRNETRHRY
jgi:hypothetical protein